MSPRVVSDPDSESWLALHIKRCKFLIVNFTVCPEKMWLFANDFKHKQIIYFWKSFFVTSMNSGSLPQNKALFGSDPLTKFLFLYENTYQWFGHFRREWKVSFWRRGRNELVRTKKGLWKWREDGVPPLWLHSSATSIARTITAASWPAWRWTQSNRHPLRLVERHVWPLGPPLSSIIPWSLSQRKERNGGLEKDWGRRDRGWVRERWCQGEGGRRENKATGNLPEKTHWGSRRRRGRRERERVGQMAPWHCPTG